VSKLWIAARERDFALKPNKPADMFVRAKRRLGSMRKYFVPVFIMLAAVATLLKREK
jgi:hypothetical protein